MRHMRFHQMPRRERRAQTQFPRQHSRRHNTGQLLRIGARGRGVRAPDAQEVEHGGLGLEDRAAAYGADFD